MVSEGLERDGYHFVGANLISLAVEIKASALLEGTLAVQSLALDDDAVVRDQNIEQVHRTFESDIEFRSSVHGNSVAIGDDGWPRSQGPPHCQPASAIGLDA